MHPAACFLHVVPMLSLHAPLTDRTCIHKRQPPGSRSHKGHHHVLEAYLPAYMLFWGAQEEVQTLKRLMVAVVKALPV
jgi:hypothetical protein